jgi:hypothetical protein
MSIKSILNSIFTAFEEERVQQIKSFDPVARQAEEQRQAERDNFEKGMEHYRKQQEEMDKSFMEMKAERERQIAERHQKFVEQHHLSEIIQTHPGSAAHLSFLILLIEDHCSNLRLNASYSDDSSTRIGETEEATKREKELIEKIDVFCQSWPQLFGSDRREKFDVLMTHSLKIKHLTQPIKKLEEAKYFMDSSLIPQYTNYQEFINGANNILEKEQLQSNFSSNGQQKTSPRTL